jgi:transcriptional regulator GlxA family with amidase domain
MHRIGYLLSDDFQVMSLATQTVFEYANLVAPAPFYAIEIFSITGGMVHSSIGLGAQTRAVDSPSWRIRGWSPASTSRWRSGRATAPRVRRSAAQQARRVAGVCTGAFVLAQAGVLDGRRATTHWAYAPALQRLHPQISVEATASLSPMAASGRQPA